MRQNAQMSDRQLCFRQLQTEQQSFQEKMIEVFHFKNAAIFIFCHYWIIKGNLSKIFIGQHSKLSIYIQSGSF